MEGEHQQRDEAADDERRQRVGGEAQPDDDDDGRGHDEHGAPEADLHPATLARRSGRPRREIVRTESQPTPAGQPIRGPATRTASETASAYWPKFSANIRASSAALRS